MVDDFDDDGELAAVWAVVDEDEATDFNKERVYLHGNKRLEMDGQVPFGLYGQVKEPLDPGNSSLYSTIVQSEVGMRRCLNCKKSHLRCDGVRPSCEQCLVKGKTCCYRPDVDGTGNKSVRIRGPPTQTKALQKQQHQQADKEVYVSEQDLLTPQVKALLPEYPESKLLDAIHAAVSGHLAYMGEEEHYYKFEPSALLALGLITEKLLEEDV